MFKPWMLLAALPLAALAEESAVYTGDVIIVEDVNPREAPAPRAERLPHRGMDMQNVRNVFGEPAREHPAVGEPPITRWDYDGYSVFFEHDKVIHSVATR